MCDVYNENCRPEAIAADHLGFKRETGFVMKSCQMCNRTFICLTAIVFNLTHWGLPYLSFMFIFVRCALGGFFLLSTLCGNRGLCSTAFHLFQGFNLSRR